VKAELLVRVLPGADPDDGAVLTIRPPGDRFAPAEVAAWLDSGTLPTATLNRLPRYRAKQWLLRLRELRALRTKSVARLVADHYHVWVGTPPAGEFSVAAIADAVTRATSRWTDIRVAMLTDGLTLEQALQGQGSPALQADVQAVLTGGPLGRAMLIACDAAQRLKAQSAGDESQARAHGFDTNWGWGDLRDHHVEVVDGLDLHDVAEFQGRDVDASDFGADRKPGGEKPGPLWRVPWRGLGGYVEADVEDRAKLVPVDRSLVRARTVLAKIAGREF
jgi:hypothetical protein